MQSTKIMVASNSHKDPVKQELKIDKLTLLLELPEAWKQGMVSRYIELVTDTSNQSQYAIARSYSKGSRGYEVSLEGKVPLSTSPLIWSTEAGYYLQAGPKYPKHPNAPNQSKKASVRLDINPLCLTKPGLAFLVMMLEAVFEIPWPVWSFARVSRIDIAVDFLGVTLTDWVWDIPKRASRELICRNREPETIYIGAKKGSPVAVYDKAKQKPASAGGGALTRVEYRLKNPGMVSDLLHLPNPFTDLVICNPRKLSYPEPHRLAMMSVGHLEGVHGILGTFPKALHTAIRQSLTNSRATWWDPAKVWQTWIQCLEGTIPWPYASTGKMHDAALAYAQSLQAEGNGSSTVAK